MTEIKATNITWHEGHVSREDRQKLLSQKGATVWFTGLSGCGKSTIAFTVEHALVERGRLAYVLDGDNVRHGLNKNLGFSEADRMENIRRIGEVAKLFADAGCITVTSFISPYRRDRDRARQIHAEAGLPFVEVFVDVPIDECEKRDPKGLGVDDPYEPPLSPEIVLQNDRITPQQAAAEVISHLEAQGILPSLGR